jgi:hypothetical protein
VESLLISIAIHAMAHMAYAHYLWRNTMANLDKQIRVMEAFLMPATFEWLWSAHTHESVTRHAPLVSEVEQFKHLLVNDVLGYDDYVEAGELLWNLGRAQMLARPSETKKQCDWLETLYIALKELGELDMLKYCTLAHMSAQRRRDNIANAEHEAEYLANASTKTLENRVHYLTHMHPAQLQVWLSENKIDQKRVDFAMTERDKEIARIQQELEARS